MRGAVYRSSPAESPLDTGEDEAKGFCQHTRYVLLCPERIHGDTDTRDLLYVESSVDHQVDKLPDIGVQAQTAGDEGPLLWSDEPVLGLRRVGPCAGD